MGETLSLFEPSFNGSVRVETRSERLSGDAGVLLLREVLDDTGLIDHLAGQLHDPRCPERVVHSLPELLRGAVALIAQGWGDQSTECGDEAGEHGRVVAGRQARNPQGGGG